MFFRKITTRSNDKEYTYVKLIENYRQGNKVKQRVVANLGNLEDLDPPRVHNLIVSLSKVCGVELPIKAKPRAKRVLRFGDVLLVHKIWEKLALNQLGRHSPNTPPDMAVALELLVIGKLLNLSPGVLNDWRRHLYLPVNEPGERPDLERALEHLAEFKEPLETHLGKRLKEWGIISRPQIYCYLLEGSLEQKDCGTPHFLSPPPERKPFELDIFVTGEGIPVGSRMFFRNFNGSQSIQERMEQAQAHVKNGKCIFVGKALPVNGFIDQEYIIGFPLSPETAEKFSLRGLLTAPLDAFHQLHEDLWYKETEAKGVRYLVCVNPLLAARKQEEPENQLLAGESAFRQIQEDSQKKEAIEKQISCSGKFLIISNSPALSGEELIRVYNDFAACQERYLTIPCPPFATGTPKMKGQLTVHLLAHLVEKLLEHALHRQGIHLSAAAALEIMEPVKITINEVAGEIIPSTITMDKTQRKILSALDAESAGFDTTDFQLLGAGQPGLPAEDFSDAT